MTNDILKKLPHVGELTLTAWREWLFQYDNLLKEQELRINVLEKNLKSRDAYLVENGLWEDFCKQVEKQDEQ